jgi:hypothetical protein
MRGVVKAENPCNCRVFRPLLAVKNLPLYGRWVRVLGLGAKYYFDYSKSATPKLRVLEDDFMGFGGLPITRSLLLADFGGFLVIESHLRC